MAPVMIQTCGQSHDMPQITFRTVRRPESSPQESRYSPLPPSLPDFGFSFIPSQRLKEARIYRLESNRMALAVILHPCNPGFHAQEPRKKISAERASHTPAGIVVKIAYFPPSDRHKNCTAVFLSQNGWEKPQKSGKKLETPRR